MNNNLEIDPRVAPFLDPFGNILPKFKGYLHLKECWECGAPFISFHKKAKYCDPACRMAGWRRMRGRPRYRKLRKY